MRRLSFDRAGPSRRRLPPRRTRAPAQPATPPPTRRSRRSRPRRRPTTERRAACSTLTDREFFIGGRVSSIDGDPARFQRYQDVRDGLLFSDFRYAFAQPDGSSTSTRAPNNVGYRDQEYFADYNRVGKLSLTGGYQQIPQFYSVDTMTPYTGSGGTLRARRRGAARRSRTAQATSTPTPASRRSSICASGATSARVDVVATPTPNLDVTASFTTQKHGGELPWGASFGFSNDVEVPLPYESRDQRLHGRHRVDEHEEHAARRLQRIVVRQPRADADLGQPAAPRRRVRRAGTRPHVAVAVELGADDQLRRLHQAGAQDAGHRLLLVRRRGATTSRCSRSRSIRRCRQIALPRATTEAEAHVFSTNLNLTSHPTTDWRFGARFRNYTYDNHMPATSITQYGQPTTRRVSTTPTGGPDLYAHNRTTFDADATWTTS